MALDAAWAGIIGTAIGTLGGGIVTYIQGKSQFQREKEWQKRDLVRGKLEEAHEAIEEVKRAFTTCTANAMLRVQLGRSEHEEKQLDFAKVKMLIGFYAPELNDLLKQLENEWVNHSKAITKSFMPPVAREGVTEMTQATAAIGEICDKMHTELAKLSRNY